MRRASFKREGNVAERFGASPVCAWLKRTARIAWRGLREWCGDSAYERYLDSKATRSGSCRALTPAEFYLEQLKRRYSRPNRCC